MEDFTIGDLGVFIGTIGGVITSILVILQKSKCKTIKFCCMTCDRDPTIKTTKSQVEEEDLTPPPNP